MEYVDGPVTQVFGAGKDFAWQLGYGHLGEDKGVPVGTTARSLADGEVIYAGWASGCPANLKNEILVMGDAPGIFVWLRHHDQHGPWESLTCHLNETHLNAGNRVARGTVIGKSGNTGLSTGPHTHYETFTRPCSNVPPFSRYNPRLQIQNEDQRFGAGNTVVPAGPAPVAANVRVVGDAPARLRKLPRTDWPVVLTLDPGQPVAFSGWCTGQFIDGLNLWFRGDQGYVHCSALTSWSTAGLPEQPAPWLAANERVAGGTAPLQRSYPYKDARLVRTIDPRTIEKFTTWCVGDTVEGSPYNVWYGDGEGWVWSGGFDNPRVDGLTKVDAPQYPKTPEPATPPQPTKPQPVDYTFTKAFPMVTEVRPAAPGNFEVGNFPAAKDVEAIFVHQFNADEVADNPTVNKVTVHLDSVINTFQGSGRVASADFGVEGTRVAQFIKVATTGGDRAYAQGAEWNGKAWSIETYGAQDPVTMATVAKLIAELEKLGGKKTLKKHSDAMATKCGNGVDLGKYRSMVDALTAPAPVTPPPVVPAPVTPPPVVPAPDNAAETKLRQIQQSITDYFTGRK